MLPVFVNLAKVFDCTYDGDVPLLDELEDDAIVCWNDTQHIVLACVGFVAFLIYYPIAVLSIPIWQNRSKGLTIKFPSYFIIVSGQLKLALSLLVAFFSDFGAFRCYVCAVATLTSRQSPCICR